MPVWSADQPSTCCTYRVRTKKLAKITAPSRKPTTFAPSSERILKIESGTSGDLERISIRIEIPSSAAETSSNRIVRAEPQPSSGAFEIA